MEIWSLCQLLLRALALGVSVTQARPQEAREALLDGPFASWWSCFPPPGQEGGALGRRGQLTWWHGRCASLAGVSGQARSKIQKLVTGRRRRKSFHTVIETRPCISSGFLDPSRGYRLQNTLNFQKALAAGRKETMLQKDKPRHDGPLWLASGRWGLSL